MEKLTKDTLSLWREEGIGEISQNFEVFRSLVTQARDFAQCGKYNTAIVYGEIAAVYATLKHCGLFVSSELEEILIDIGIKVIPKYSYPSKSKFLPKKPKNILHVSSSLMSIGGLSKLLWRWIEQDTERSHSLVLTRQPRKEVPQILRNAVINSGGKVYWLNETIGSIIHWAKQLRKIAAAADMVVLHIYNHDVIPIIAFANKEQCPPIIFLNHADHMFWLGSGISDVVVNLRESGMRLSQQRRGIETKRNVLLPTILEPIHRKIERAEAKRQLGLPENSIVLLSIARAIKYKTINGISFADVHIPLLEQYRQTFLVVIGPGDLEDWSVAIQQTQGRIIVYGERADTEVFYQAADIYIDSFPFVSITSLLEAGSYGVPLVSRYPYSSDLCEIIGADMPGLTGNLIRVRELKEYTTVLSRLIEDEEWRLNLGEATRKKITQIHTGSNWLHSLNNVYNLAATIPSVAVPPDLTDQMFLGEPDIFIPSVFGWDLDLDNLIQSHITMMPIDQRLRHWFRLHKKHGFQNNGTGFSSLKYLVPEWLLWQLRSNLQSKADLA